MYVGRPVPAVLSSCSKIVMLRADKPVREKIIDYQDTRIGLQSDLFPRNGCISRRSGKPTNVPCGWSRFCAGKIQVRQQASGNFVNSMYSLFKLPTACFVHSIHGRVFLTAILSHPCTVTADTGRPRQFVAPQFFFVARGSEGCRVHVPAKDSLSHVLCRTRRARRHEGVC